VTVSSSVEKLPGLDAKRRLEAPQTKDVPVSGSCFLRVRSVRGGMGLKCVGLRSFGLVILSPHLPTPGLWGQGVSG
jgi:hypothetical protein